MAFAAARRAAIDDVVATDEATDEATDDVSDMVWERGGASKSVLEIVRTCLVC